MDFLATVYVDDTDEFSACPNSSYHSFSQLKIHLFTLFFQSVDNARRHSICYTDKNDLTSQYFFTAELNLRLSPLKNGRSAVHFSIFSQFRIVYNFICILTIKKN